MTLAGRLACVTLAGAAGFIGYRLLRTPAGEQIETIGVDRPLRGGPSMCPWREPELDMKAFFKGAESYRTDVLVLSHHRLEILKRLGPGSRLESNALYAHRVLHAGAVIGTVIVRRISGPHGAIEIVAAIDPAGKIAGVRIQRHREPQAVGSAITSPVWLSSFRGVGPESDIRTPNVSASAEEAAKSIEAAVHSILIELSVVERSLPSGVVESPHIH